MKLFLSIAAALSLVFVAVPETQAGGVTVKKAHVCCGQCVTIVKKTLTDLEGVTNPGADQKTGTITFDAADDAAAKRGIEALAKAGFHGSAAHGDKAVEFPKTSAKKGDKANTVTFTGVHLCCGQCVTGAKKALENIKNVEINVDRATQTVTLTGKDIDVLEVVNAFNAGGFHGNLKDEKKPE
jgi:copper chaperone CopZ